MRVVTILTGVCLCLSVSAETLRFEGVLGNSGELDKPVTFGSMAHETRGLGAAYDAARGVLYDRAGSGTLNAYALDGRLLAQYRLPTDADHRDALTLCGEHLVMLLGGNLYRLRLNAPDGMAATKVTAAINEPDGLSSSAREGRVAVRNQVGQIVLLNPADDALTPFGEAPGKYCKGMDWDDKGNFFLVFDKEVHKLENGTLVSNAQWPKRFAGDRESGIDCATRLGAYWFGSAYHGTIKRFTAAFEPSPGVVLGGASGHFIGHVPCNYDAQGRVLAGKNIWNWRDDALAPADVSHVFKLVAPCAAWDEDTAVGLAEVYGKGSVAMGAFDEENFSCNRLDKLELPEEVVGVALYREQPGRKGGRRLLALGAAGRAKVHELVEDRRNPWRKDLGEVKLQTASPVKVFTAVTMKDAETLLAAADGQVIEFARDGADWKETGRWSDGFGPKVRLAVDAGRLAVADTEKGRVAVYALADRGPLAETRVDSPTEIALNGSFLVAYDSAGQRLVKYLLGGQGLR